MKPIVMLMAYEVALTAVYQALSELNLQRPQKARIPLSADTELIGNNGVLDSLDLANLILITEQRVSEALGIEVDLTEDDPFSSVTGHFRTVHTLASHVSRLVDR